MICLKLQLKENNVLFTRIRNSIYYYSVFIRRPDFIEYVKFAKVVEEAVATGGLEKVPLLVPLQHVPSEASDKNFLNFDERQTVAIAMDKLSTVSSPNLDELFKVSIESYICKLHICIYI